MVKAAPPQERIDPAVWKIAAVAIVGALLSVLDATIINVSLSSLARELHCGLSTIQWVTSGYLLALALVLPLNGWLVDRIGGKALYLYCFTAFTISSALCGCAWSAGSLIGFRVLQGISGGLMAPMAQFMLARAAGRNMARVMGMSVIPVLIGPILGPVLAGVILQHASWRWLFFVNLPVGVIAVIMAVVLLPNDRDETRKRTLDLTGLALLSPGLVLFLYGSEHLEEPSGLGCFIFGMVLLGAFLWMASLKKERALIDLQLFRSKVFPVSAVTQFMTNGISFAGQMLVPLYLTRACGLSPSAAGWSMAPLGLGMAVAYPSVGALTQRFGIRKVAAAGALIGLAGSLPVLYLAETRFVPAILAVALFVRGAGMGLVGIPSMTSAYASIAKEELPMATTTLNIVQRIGGPTLTTLCAIALGWRVGLPGFAAAFALLSFFHACIFISAMCLPILMPERSEKALVQLSEAVTE